MRAGGLSIERDLKGERKSAEDPRNVNKSRERGRGSVHLGANDEPESLEANTIVPSSNPYTHQVVGCQRSSEAGYAPVSMFAYAVLCTMLSRRISTLAQHLEKECEETGKDMPRPSIGFSELVSLPAGCNPPHFISFSFIS